MDRVKYLDDPDKNGAAVLTMRMRQWLRFVDECRAVSRFPRGELVRRWAERINFGREKANRELDADRLANVVEEVVARLRTRR